MTQKQYCYTAAAELLYEHFAYISAYTKCTLLFSLLTVCTDVHTLFVADTEEQGGCNYTVLTVYYMCLHYHCLMYILILTAYCMYRNTHCLLYVLTQARSLL
jgi:hypothetical protein